MARMLGRARSLRILRGGHRETPQNDDSGSAPLSAGARMEENRLKAGTPVTAMDNHFEPLDMSQRPKTSSGAGDHSKQFHRKVSPAHLSPRESSRFPFPSPNHSSTTILYAAEVHEDREGVIGIALGSPSMNPTWDLTPKSTNFVNNGANTVTQISSNTPLSTPTDAQGSKPKTSRWKSFFARKPQLQEPKTTKFYQLAQVPTPPRQDSHQDHQTADWRATPHATDSYDHLPAKPLPTSKAEIRESRKRPKGEQPPIATRSRGFTNLSNKSKTSLSRSTTSPLPMGQQNDTSTIPQLIISGDPQDGAHKSNGDTLLLDVDIPDIKMERYSVMFGNLLQQPANHTSSLLVRRQGGSDNLKPLDLSVKNETQGRGLKPPRRATSPVHTTKSPSAGLSLFPQARTPSPSPRTIMNTVNKTRLHRSKTAPELSPSRQTFDFPFTSSPTKISHSNETSQDERSRTNTSVNEDPKQMPHIFTPTRHSFESNMPETPMTSGQAVGTPWQTDVDEPAWEVVSRPLQRTALSSHPATAPGPSSAPSKTLKPHTDDKPTPRSADRLTTSTTTTTSPSALNPKPQSPRSTTVQSTTTIGIARSVSVSRANPRSADLLKPSLVRRGTERSASRSPAAETFVNRKPLTPTLVELGNRRSQRVQLVDV